MKLTLHECSKRLREAGMPMSPESVANGIERGILPFGTLLCTGDAGRRTFLILRADLENWISKMKGECK